MKGRYEKYFLVGFIVFLIAFVSWVMILALNAPVVPVTPVVNESSNSESGAESEFGTGCPAVGRNPTTENGIPHWWCWSKEDWPKFQWYANETEAIWDYDETTGEKRGGEVMVAGEPLTKAYSSGLLGDRDEESAFYGFNSISPVKYLEGQRKGNCGGVSIICYCLFTVKGEEVMLTSAQVVDRNGNPGLSHTWVEWTDKESNKWVINFDTVMPLDKWYQGGNWTVSWVQWKPGEYEVHSDGSVVYFK